MFSQLPNDNETSLFTASGRLARAGRPGALASRRGYPELAATWWRFQIRMAAACSSFQDAVAAGVRAGDPHNWLIRFPPQEMSFAGRGKPPTRFLLLYLPAALAVNRCRSG